MENPSLSLEPIQVQVMYPVMVDKTMAPPLMSLSVAMHEQTKTNSVVRALCGVISLSQQCGAALLVY